MNSEKRSDRTLLILLWGEKEIEIKRENKSKSPCPTRVPTHAVVLTTREKETGWRVSGVNQSRGHRWERITKNVWLASVTLHFLHFLGLHLRSFKGFWKEKHCSLWITNYLKVCDLSPNSHSTCLNLGFLYCNCKDLHYLFKLEHFVILLLLRKEKNLNACQSPRNLRPEWLIFEKVLQTFSFNTLFMGHLLCA